MIEKIKHWREVFGLPNRTVPQIPSDKEMALSFKLILEETEELKLAIENYSLNDIADAIGDLYFVVTQMAMVCGLDPKELVEKVYDSNMSKLCLTIEESLDSVFEYKRKGMDVYAEKFNEYYILKRLSDGKVLKSINFKEPNWNYDNDRQ